MSPELGRNVLILVAFVVLGWFALGTQLNIRHGNRLLRWLGQGLPLVGERTTLRWLGSSAIELKVQTALEPLRSAEVFVVLEPRDLPLLWWLFRARGRRDLLIVRAELRRAPRIELEAFRPGAWSARGRARALGREHWIPVPLPVLLATAPTPTASGSPLVAYAPRPADVTADLLPLIPGAEGSLVRVAVRQTAPQLEAQWELRGLERLEARAVLETFQRLAARL
jgi:hypothetical protein